VKSDFLTAPTGGAATVGTTGTTDAWGMPVAAASPSQVPFQHFFLSFLHLSFLFVLFACLMSSKSQQKKKKKNEFYIFLFLFRFGRPFPVETTHPIYLLSFFGEI
jgi:NADH:ubiquinone oxidoreductase subunit 2 (subunit N)